MRRAYSSTGHQVVIEQIKQKDTDKKYWEKGAVHTYITGGWYILT